VTQAVIEGDEPMSVLGKLSLSQQAFDWSTRRVSTSLLPDDPPVMDEEPGSEAASAVTDVLDHPSAQRGKWNA